MSTIYNVMVMGRTEASIHLAQKINGLKNEAVTPDSHSRRGSAFASRCY